MEGCRLTTRSQADARKLPSGVTGARSLVASIGTCSIDEPVEALVARRLL